jgi:hypothetical protein
VSIHPDTDDGSIRPARTTGSQSAGLPVTRSLPLAYACSLIIALLALIASLAGLLYGATLYPTEEMRILDQPTDLFTLLVGLPLLLGSMWLAWRGKLLGLLCWPGVLLYMLYVYLAYAIGVPFNVLFLAYVLLVALSAYTTIGLIASIDAAAVRRRLAGAVSERLAGGILAGLAILFTMMNVADVITAIASPEPDHLLQLPVWIADFAVLAPAWLLGGLLLWKRRALGYLSGAGLLLVGSMLFAGVIVALAFPALYAGSALDLTGMIFVLAMGLICFVPFGLYVRGIVNSERSSSPAGHAGPDSRQGIADERQTENGRT